MSDDKNVVDFGARAALERSRRTGFLLTELDGAACKAIFDAAYIDCRLDGDGDCVVRDEMSLMVSAEPTRDIFKLCATPLPARETVTLSTKSMPAPVTRERRILQRPLKSVTHIPGPSGTG